MGPEKGHQSGETVPAFCHLQSGSNCRTEETGGQGESYSSERGGKCSVKILTQASERL